MLLKGGQVREVNDGGRKGRSRTRVRTLDPANVLFVTGVRSGLTRGRSFRVCHLVVTACTRAAGKGRNLDEQATRRGVETVGWLQVHSSSINC